MHARPDGHRLLGQVDAEELNCHLLQVAKSVFNELLTEVAQVEQDITVYASALVYLRLL